MRKFREYRQFRFWAFFLGAAALGGILVATIGRLFGISLYESYSGAPGYFLTGLWMVVVLRAVDSLDDWLVKPSGSLAD